MTLEPPLKEALLEREGLLNKIADAGVYGGMRTSEAIENLEAFDAKFVERFNKRVKTLRKWAVVACPANPYTAPEQIVSLFHGDSFDGDRHRSNVTTSPIVGVIGKVHALTESGSIYELMDVDPEWEKLYPDSAERFFSNAPNL